MPADPTDLLAARERGCPMPGRKHRITDRDGVVSCVLCHHVFNAGEWPRLALKEPTYAD